MSKLKHLRPVHRALPTTLPLRATDVLRQKMHVYNTEAKTILASLVKEIKESGTSNFAQLKSLYQLMQKADDIVIDCAHKIAPYESPKLESIEVKSKVEHKFVIRAPQQIKSTKEWMDITGAEKLKVKDTLKEVSKTKSPEPSIHDYDSEEEEYTEPGMVH